MSARDAIRAIILRGEVDHIDRGRDHVESMRERELERAAEKVRLRAAPSRHPEIFEAAARRLRLIK